jgi:glutamyl-tRNA(Gln) amidotransferase subunit E
MESVDYERLGFKSGVEVHQQLLTRRKLFCRCPAGIYTTRHDGELLRHMRPTLSEMGTYDGTALMEYKKKKEIIYLLNYANVCTYEMDDTPPFLIDQEALDIGIEIALLFGCQIVDELHIARKQYLDGSIPTGFQRTAIIGVGGTMPFRGRPIGIRQISIEEDSCREVSDLGHTITFRTDRLGMPLVEIVTEPDMVTPEEVAAVTNQIGRVMRATFKVRRGIGATRQDVNVSITGGTRIEIKGVPRFPLIPELVHYEAVRQKVLLDLRDELGRRGLAKDRLVTQEMDVSDLFRIRPPFAAPDKEAFAAICIRGFGGLFNLPTAPGRTFAGEVVGRVRVVACLDVMPNLMHTDMWPIYPGGPAHRKALLDKFKAKDGDVVVVVWGNPHDAKTAIGEIRLRCLDAFDGVPGETRQVMADGTTDFERILPGPDRMYPDTDHPPTRITEQRLDGIRRQLPEAPWVREARYVGYGIPRNDAETLATSPLVTVFESLEKEKYAHLKTAAVILTEIATALRREGIQLDQLATADLLALFGAFAKQRFQREGFPRILRRLAAGEGLGAILADPGFRPVDKAEATAAVASAHATSGFTFKLSKTAEDQVRAYMRPVMDTLRGRYPGALLEKMVVASLKPAKRANPPAKATPRPKAKAKAKAKPGAKAKKK